jgi:DNA-binding transcriptional MerR regulator
MSTLLTLPEFAEVAARVVAASGATPDNRQAKAVPAARMIRYYTARGLLPRPGSRGRALVYGRRHILQLVAIKRLQGEGLSLGQIAERLAGLSDADLEALAAVPGEAMPPELGDLERSRPGEPSRTAERFWDRAPAEPAVAAPRSVTAPSPVIATQVWRSERPPATGPRRFTEIRLSDSVRLVVEGGASGLPGLEVLRAAADPLLRLLVPDPAPPRGKEPS